ncbi:MAG TPA: XrtA/PEP-CTERM system amidotransferase [Steroidobacteraceae bacterium]|jgi:asparagine synthase (glutamine-hydrolysing)
MCGIVGIFDLTASRELDRELLRKMNQVQSHRGPDEHGEHCEPGVALGHRRLSIIDLSSGQQPLYNEDGSVAIIFNGEIYNFAGLRTELESAGHRFRTHSDTEVIVHAWEQWGERCVERFNGMFAFAIWDRNQRSLFLARDRLGKKPVYYVTTSDGRLLFASELKSLLVDPAVPRDLDYEAVEDYFALGYVPDPKTILTAVRKLPPGHTLLVRNKAPVPAPREYWDLSSVVAAGLDESPAAPNELIERLREAVRIRLVSEVPLGAFLSGGVDSSGVVAMMAGLSSSPVNTCSISFGEREYDESRYAQEIAQRYSTDHFVGKVDPDDFSLLDTLVKVYDEPFADSSAIPTYRVCQLARKRVTVALSGDGGDEVFAGYRRYRWHMNEEAVRARLPLGLRRAVFGPAGALYPKLDWAPKVLRAKATLQGLARDSVGAYFHSVAVTSEEIRRKLYSSTLKQRLNGYSALEVFRKHAARVPMADPLSTVQYIDFKTYLPGDILVKVDRAAMAHSLEVRVPMLDYTFVEWAASLPPSAKLVNGSGKRILKKSLEPYVSNDILYRPKMGFAVPIAAWFRGPLKERVRSAILEGALVRSGLFDEGTLRNLVDEHQSGIRDYSTPLWTALMFEGFLRQTVSA